MGQARQRVIRYLILLHCFSGTALFAQFNLGYQFSSTVGVTEGSSLSMPMVGGFDNPQFSEIRLNNDSETDMFVFDRVSNTWRTFVYDGTSNTYVYAPEYERYIPKTISEMVLLRDYNCDGHMDIFAYRSGGIAVYQNDGFTPPHFTLVTDRIQSTYGSITTGMYLLPGDLPAITDVDGDGDLDILTFGNASAENTIEYHQNQSMELFSSCDSLRFNVVTQCWGGVEEPPNSNTLVAVSCKGIIPPGALRAHPGSTLLAIDTDNDGDKDIVIGDIQTDEVVFAVNVGDAQQASIDVNQQTTLFPNATNPAKMQFMLAGYELDTDKDGNPDVIFSVNNRIDSSCNDDHVWLFRNTSSGAANYVRTSTGFLQDQMLDLGSGAVPVTMDVDGDGLLDLLIANAYRRTDTEYTGARLHYFRNTGTATSPHFTLVNSNFANWSALQFKDPHPALADMDDDGDLDMLVGTADGELHYFTNTATGAVANFVLSEPFYKSINTIGNNAAPELTDVDGDGLLDLLVGEKMGTLAYFKNTGNASTAEFATSPTISKFGKIDVSYFCCSGYAAPRWIDGLAFGSGIFLFVGTSEKKIKIYQITENLSDSFPLVDSIEINAGRIAPVFSDWNSDGIVDLLTGTGEGGMRFYQRDKNYTVGVNNSSASQAYEVLVYPNPASQSLTVMGGTDSELKLIDIMGRVVLETGVRSVPFVVDVRDISEGFYTAMILSPQGSSTLPIVITRAIQGLD